jgi:hypothetical protein
MATQDYSRLQERRVEVVSSVRNVRSIQRQLGEDPTVAAACARSCGRVGALEASSPAAQSQQSQARGAIIMMMAITVSRLPGHSTVSVRCADLGRFGGLVDRAKFVGLLAAIIYLLASKKSSNEPAGSCTVSTIGTSGVGLA